MKQNVDSRHTLQIATRSNTIKRGYRSNTPSFHFIGGVKITIMLNEYTAKKPLKISLQLKTCSDIDYFENC